jgi:hypothetical protein
MQLRLNCHASAERDAADTPPKQRVDAVDLWVNGASENILRGTA